MMFTTLNSFISLWMSFSFYTCKFHQFINDISSKDVDFVNINWFILPYYISFHETCKMIHVLSVSMCWSNEN